MPTPLHEWKLDETSGLLLDTGSSTNPKSGTATGTTSVPGLFGNARRYDANADRILIDLLTDFTFGTAVGTWVIHFKAPTVTNGQERMLVTKRDGGDLAFAIGLTGYSLDYLYASFYGTPANKTVIGPKCQDGLIHTMVVTFDPPNQTYRMYIDAIQVAMITDGPSVINAAATKQICIGNYTATWDQSWFFTGGQDTWVDTVQLYDTLLSIDDIENLNYTPLATIVLTDLDPAADEAEVAVLKSPVVAIEDDVNSIDLTTVSIWVDSVLAYDGATDTWQTGFTGSWSGDASKYTFTINPDDPFAMLDTIPIRVYAENDVGHILDQTYSFTTDDTTISLTDQDPEPEEHGVLIAKTVNVAVQDGDESVAAASIKVWIHSILAYDGEAGGFQEGFSGTFGGTPAKYSLAIDHVVRFQYSHTIPVTVAATNALGPTSKSYRFFTEDDTYPPEIYAQDPAPSATLVRADKTIKFRLWDGMPMNLTSLIVDVDFGDGTYELAYDTLRGGSTLGFATTITLVAEEWGGFAYEITVAHDRLFASGGTVRVRVHILDTAGAQNPLDVVYTFTAAVPPGVGSASPAADAVGVPSWSNVAFTVTGGSGTVTLSTVVVKIEGVTAYADSEFKTGYDGTVTANGSGYDFVINPTNDLPRSSGIIVEVTGQNSLGHDIV